MSAAESQPEGPPLEPLDMARNLAAEVERLARWAEADPVQAQVHNAGGRQHSNGELAGWLALVSVALDLRRVADHLTGRGEL